MAGLKLLDVSGALDLSKHIGTLSGTALGAAGIDALNETVDGTYTKATARMIVGVNLSEAYVQRKMVVKHATNEKPTASITALGVQTPLSEYGATQLVRPVNWTNERIEAAGHKFGKWPGWTRRTGAPRVGVPVNQKSAGRAVTIKRGAVTTFEHTFAIPGKSDGEGNLLVFSRNPSTGKLRALLGPAAYQLFAYQIQLLQPEISDDLATSLYSHIDDAIAAAFE